MGSREVEKKRVEGGRAAARWRGERERSREVERRRGEGGQQLGRGKAAARRRRRGEREGSREVERGEGGQPRGGEEEGRGRAAARWRGGEAGQQRGGEEEGRGKASARWRGRAGPGEAAAGCPFPWQPRERGKSSGMRTMLPTVHLGRARNKKHMQGKTYEHYTLYVDNWSLPAGLRPARLLGARENQIQRVVRDPGCFPTPGSLQRQEDHGYSSSLRTGHKIHFIRIFKESPMFQVWCVCAARDGVDTLDAACALLIQAKSAGALST